MINLLKFEFRKLWQSKSLYFVFGAGLLIALLLMILEAVLRDIIKINLNACESIMIMLQNGRFSLLLGAFVAIFVCSDYSQHTIKNVYARGYSRTAVYFSKYFVSLFITIVMALFYMAFGFVVALILGGDVGSLEASAWGNLALQFLILVGLHGMYFGISMIVNKMAGSLILNLVGITFAFLIVNAIISIAKIKFNIQNYNLDMLLLGVSGTPEMVKDTLLEANISMNLVRTILTPICYAIIFVFSGWLVNRRRDV